MTNPRKAVTDERNEKEPEKSTGKGKPNDLDDSPAGSNIMQYPVSFILMLG